MLVTVILVKNSTSISYSYTIIFHVATRSILSFSLSQAHRPHTDCFTTHLLPYGIHIHEKKYFKFFENNNKKLEKKKKTTRSGYTAYKANHKDPHFTKD